MGSYKNVTTETNVSAVEDAISDLEELGNECREIVDNASDGLKETSRIQTFDETAGTLEGISAPDIPECVADLTMTVTTQQSTRKGRGESRAVRCSNAVSVLQAASEAAQQWLDENEAAPAEGVSTAEHHALRDEVVDFIAEVDDIISDAESCEFPGMYG